MFSRQNLSNGCLLYVRLCHNMVEHTSRMMLDVFLQWKRKKQMGGGHYKKFSISFLGAQEIFKNHLQRELFSILSK